MKLDAPRIFANVLAGGLAAVLLSPVPAMARERGPSELSQRLNDPEMQRGMANALAAMTEALMSIRLAPFAEAMDKMGDKKTARRIDRNATLGDMAGRDGQRVQREVAERVPQMMGMMAGMAGAMEQMLPALEAMGRQMEGAMKGAVPGAMPPADDRDYQEPPLAEDLPEDRPE
jgi:hypothetical protein